MVVGTARSFFLVLMVPVREAQDGPAKSILSIYAMVGRPWVFATSLTRLVVVDVDEQKGERPVKLRLKSFDATVLLGSKTC